MPIGAVGNPHFEDFTNTKEDRTTRTHHLLGAIHQIRQASITADFNGKLNLRLIRRLRQSVNGVFLAQSVFSLLTSRGGKRGNVGWAHG